MAISLDTQGIIRKFKERFSRIAADVLVALPLQIDSKDPSSLKAYVNELGRGHTSWPLVPESVEPPTQGRILSALQSKWSFTNPGLLQYIVNYLNDQSLKKRLKEYCHDYASFYQSLIDSKKTRSLYQSNPCLILVIDSETDETYDGDLDTLNFLENICKHYFRVHKIRKSDAMHAVHGK